MRSPFLVLLTLLSLVLPCSFLHGQEKSVPPQRGKNLPGPFHPYNVTGNRKGFFHCLVSQNSLDPFVIIFTKDLTFSDPLKTLLQELDTAAEKNPNIRLGVFVVFLSDELPDVVVEDDKREELEAKIKALGEDQLKLKHIVLTLFSPKYLADYNLDKDAETTVILVDNYEVQGTSVLPQLTAENVMQIREEVAAKLGAVRK